jgi:hypothetical protein
MPDGPALSTPSFRPRPVAGLAGLVPLLLTIVVALAGCAIAKEPGKESEIENRDRNELAYVGAGTESAWHLGTLFYYSLHRIDGHVVDLNNVYVAAVLPGRHKLEYVHRRWFDPDPRILVEIDALPGRLYVPHIGGQYPPLYVDEHAFDWVLGNPSKTGDGKRVAEGVRAE